MFIYMFSEPRRCEYIGSMYKWFLLARLDFGSTPLDERERRSYYCCRVADPPKNGSTRENIDSIRGCIQGTANFPAVSSP